MKLPRESYTIPERPADPPAMRPAAYRPMPPGYQGTVPILPEETRQAIRDAFAQEHSPPPSWWQANKEALLRVLASAKDGDRL